MQKVTRTSIKHLIDEQKGPVLTLYVPTHRYPTPPNMQEDQTRFKNLVRKGCEQWKQVADHHAVDRMHQQLEEKLNDLPFWQQTTESLAVFVTLEGYEIYQMPIETEERSYVGMTFDVTPLLILLELNRPFYVFALAKHRPKLFKGDMYGLEPVAIDFPESPEDALNIDEMFSGSNTVRGREGVGGDNAPSSPHGQGDSNAAGQEERLKFLRILDDKIMHSQLVDQDAPILVAATDSEAGTFKSLTKNQNVLPCYLAGNYTDAPLPQLHKLAMEMLHKEVVEKHMKAAIDQYGVLRGSRASDDMKEIERAADEGRIDTLFIGMLDSTTDSVSDISEDALLIRYFDKYDDTMMRMIRKVIASSGRILALTKEHMPGTSLMAAIHRY